MNKKIIFFGTLRSKKILKNVIGREVTSLQFTKCFIQSVKLKNIKNENYPGLYHTNNKSNIVEAVLVENLNKNDLKRIKFFESYEYVLDTIWVIIDGKKNIVNYFRPIIKKEITNKAWSYTKWKKTHEKFDAECAYLWMDMYKNYSQPIDVEQFWPDILAQAKKNLKKT